jgi:hypothetical protein
MKGLDIRKYSSPFSYMVIDLETSINFINNKFINFLNVTNYKIHEFKWNDKYWNHSLFFNKDFLLLDDNININEMKRICCWNHHDLNDDEIISSINRRYNYLLKCIESEENTLLIYIENINTYTTSNYDEYYNYKMCDDFINNRQNIFLCLLIPLLDFPYSPKLYNTKNNNIIVIFYNSNMDGSINDYQENNNTIEWLKIKELIQNCYNFEIKERIL